MDATFLAARFAAWACRRVPARALMLLVGLLLSGLSRRTLLQALPA